MPPDTTLPLGPPLARPVLRPGSVPAGSGALGSGAAGSGAPGSVKPGSGAPGGDRLDRLWARGAAFLGSRYAIMGGAMSWVSERRLVSAISNAGGFGVIAGGSMGPDALAAEIAGTQALTAAPFGVNLITMHPELDALIGACVAAGVGHVVLAGGVPKGATVRRVKDGGARVIGFAPALPLAQRMIRAGVDALVVEGSEAGGHIGPVSLSVLAQEILPCVHEVPVFVAGGLGRGEMIAAFLRMGASGAQLGTRFAAARESIAHPRFKQAFIHARARDAQASVQLDPAFPVIPVRALANAATGRFAAHQAEMVRRVAAGELSREQAQLGIEHFWAGALRRAVVEGDVENGSVMAGQSVGMVTHEQPVAEIIEALVGQARLALDDRLQEDRPLEDRPLEDRPLEDRQVGVAAYAPLAGLA